MSALTIGSEAPDFELEGTAESPVRLSEELKKARFVVLAFFPAAFSSVCTDELNFFQESLDEFSRLGARVLGISVDNRWSLQEFARKNGLSFPLLADFHPKGKVAGKYGVMREDGVTERALFLVDARGRIRYSFVSELSKNPGLGGVLEALDEASAEG